MSFFLLCDDGFCNLFVQNAAARHTTFWRNKNLTFKFSSIKYVLNVKTSRSAEV